MTIDELEALPPDDGADPGGDAIFCNFEPDVDDASEKEFESKEAKKLTVKILKQLFGAGWTTAVKESKPAIEALVTKVFEDKESVEDDLGETLDLLEKSLFLLERIHSMKPSLLGTDIINHLEESRDWLDQWGMGVQDIEDQGKRD